MMGQKSFTHMCTDPLMDRCLDRPIRKWRLKVGKLVLIPFVAGMLKPKYNFLPRNVAKTSTCAHFEDNILDQTCFGKLIITDDQSCKSHISVLQHFMYRSIVWNLSNGPKNEENSNTHCCQCLTLTAWCSKTDLRKKWFSHLVESPLVLTPMIPTPVQRLPWNAGESDFCCWLWRSVSWKLAFFLLHFTPLV